jgi:energy-coupling factor transporter ATPase
MIELKDVYYSYRGRRALCGVSLEIKKGRHLALVGPNASGKSTLALMMNAQLLPDSGDCIVDGMSTKELPLHARRSIAMVFQNPDDQLVSRKVWEDVAFGPRNLGLPDAKVGQRVKNALLSVGLEGYEDRSSHTLSGGQKQLLAIAGALAMEPDYIVLDEPTALLDCIGARAVRDVVLGLKQRGKGIIWITHDMEEAMAADIVAVLKEGKILASMTPGELFSDQGILAEAGLEAPYSWRLKKSLEKMHTQEAVNELWP